MARAKEQPNRYCNGVLRAAFLSDVLSSVSVPRWLGGIKGKGHVAQRISGSVRFGNRWLVISLGKKVLVSCWDGDKEGAS